MSLSIGLVGLPNAGKSTLFNALTKLRVLAANYPFATIDPNVGLVSVPDPRLDQLAKLFPGTKIVPAAVSFTDIAGLVAGASQGQGLGNQFLSHIRETSSICQVVRAFSDPNVIHVAGQSDPAVDIATLNTELVLADLQTLDRQLPRLESRAKADPKLRSELEQLAKLRAALNDGKFAAQSGVDSSQWPDLNLLSARPWIFVFNIDESDLADSELQHQLIEIVKPAPAVCLCAKTEAELSELDPAEASELLRSLGQERSGLEQLIELGHRALKLQTFLTAGPKEVRAWTIPVGATAPQAAGVIHTDFERGFIRAEVVNWEDLVSAGSLAAAKAAGKVRSEGRDYIMRDGDVVEFRFNL